MDAFALPVEGTKTRVNAQADAYEYMVDYSQTNKQECWSQSAPARTGVDFHNLSTLSTL
ncbi:hypothetical protein JHK86_019322 [Glycine max]|nr:hypothetical protein JHK86_019322 [Glycine max]